MKKIIVGITVMVFLVAGLYAGKYDDAIPVMETMLKLMNGLGDGVTNAKDENDVAAAFNKFSDGMKKLIPDMVKIQKKYPELDKMKDNPPEELKEYQKKMEDAGKKMMGAMMAVMGKYAQSKVVQDAQAKMMQVQQELTKAMQEAKKEE